MSYSTLHLHDVLDDDFHFVIKPDTREIVYTDEKELLLVQGDHNSERCTFDIPKMIDGHDMTECNVIRVHFINISSEDQNNTSLGLYEVPTEDIIMSTSDPTKMSFSWLITKEATEYVGTISFLIEFLCTDGNKTIHYSWHTGIYTGGTVQRGINNTEIVIGQYYDVLNKWVELIANEGNRVKVDVVEQVSADTKTMLESYAETIKQDITEHAVDGLSIDGVLVNELGNSTRKVVSQDKVTKEVNRLDSELNTKFVEVRTDVNAVKETFQKLVLDTARVYREILPGADGSIKLGGFGKTYLVKSTKSVDSWGFTIQVDKLGYYNDSLGHMNYEYGIDITPDKQYSYTNGYTTVRILGTAIERVEGTKTDVYCNVTIEVDGIYSVFKIFLFSGVTNLDTYIGSVECSISGCTQVLELEDPTDQLAYKIEANSIDSKTKTNTVMVDGVPTHTYTILLTDGTKTTFDIKDGVGIADISIVDSGVYENTYNIELTNGTSVSFKVPSATIYNSLLARITAIEKHLGISDDVVTIKLSKPKNIRFLSTGHAIWDHVSNAFGYRYRIYSDANNYEDVEIDYTKTITSSALTNGQSISVQAIGDGMLYSDSEWSDITTYNKQEDPDDPVNPSPIKLSTPVFNSSSYGDLTTWNKIENSTGYRYIVYDIDGTTIVTDHTILSNENVFNDGITYYAGIILTNGQSIKVKALGDDINYSDSDWSELVTHTAPAEPDTPSPTKLDTPEFHRFNITNSAEALAIFTKVANATLYVIRIYKNGDTEYVDNANDYHVFGDSVYTLTPLYVGDSISIQAIGDGVNYSNSDWSQPITYTAPEEPNTPLVYYGVGNVEGSDITSDFVTSLTSVEQDSIGCSFTVSPSTQYVYFVAPKSYCVDGNGNNIVKFEAGGLDQTGTFNSPQSVTIDSVEYYVYRSVYTLTWTNLTITVPDTDAPDQPEEPDVPDTPSLQKLPKPNVTIHDNGAVTWTTSLKATSYKVVIFGGSPDNEITSLDFYDGQGIELNDGQGVKVMMIGDGINYSNSDWSEPTVYTKPEEPDIPDTPSLTKLEIPKNVRTDTQGVVSFNIVQNASGYSYKIFDSSASTYKEATAVFTTTSDGRIIISNATLHNDDSVSIRAIGDGINYSDSDWSDAVTYTAPKLDTPVVNIQSNKAGGYVTWDAVEYATGYKCRVYSVSGSFIEYAKTNDLYFSGFLKDGESVSVKAIGNNIFRVDSDWSQPITYTAPEEPNTPLVYYGVGNVEGSDITSDFVTSLTSVEQDSIGCSFTVSPSTQYVYFVAPKSYCVDGNGNNIVKFEAGGLDQTGTFNSPQSVTIDSVEYYVYRSVYTLTWTNLTITVT